MYDQVWILEQVWDLFGEEMKQLAKTCDTNNKTTAFNEQIEDDFILWSMPRGR